MDFGKKTLERRLEFKGKFATKGKFKKISTKADLSIAYMPGVAAVSSL